MASSFSRFRPDLVRLTAETLQSAGAFPSIHGLRRHLESLDSWRWAWDLKDVCYARQELADREIVPASGAVALLGGPG